MSKVTEKAEELGLRESVVQTAVVDWLNARKNVEITDTNVSSIIRMSVETGKPMINYMLPLMAGVIYSQVASQGTKALNNKLSGFRTLTRQVCESLETKKLFTVVAKEGEQGAYQVEEKDWPQDTTAKELKKVFTAWLKLPNNADMDKIHKLMKLHQAEVAAKLGESLAEELSSKEQQLADVRMNQKVLDSIADSKQIVDAMKKHQEPVIKKVANG